MCLHVPISSNSSLFRAFKSRNVQRIVYMQILLQLAVVSVIVCSQSRLILTDPADQEFCSAPETAMLRPQFVLFGDSLTQKSFDEGGWAGRLANEYQRKVSQHPHMARGILSIESVSSVVVVLTCI
jgi:hypothetical protein